MHKRPLASPFIDNDSQQTSNNSNNTNNISSISGSSRNSSRNSSSNIASIGNVAGSSSSHIGRQSGSSMCFTSSATNGAQGGGATSSSGAGSSSASGGGGNGSGAGAGGSGGSSSPSTSKGDKQRDDNGGGIINSILCGCQKAPKSHCISATGVLLLVLLYTAVGSLIFVTLEGELDDANALETAVAASKPYPRTELANAEIRSRTVDRLWSITEDLNILYKENWTRLAAQEVQLFQDTLLRAVRQSKVYQPGGVQMNAPTHKWTYASAFLYSLTLITTIGYGGVSPRTQWGRVAALVYALFGIPIVLLYLSAMGEALSAGMRCLFRRQRAKSSVASGPTPGPSGSRKTDKVKGQGQQYGHSATKMHNQYGLSTSVYQQQQQQQQQEQQQQQQQQQQQEQQQQQQQGKKSAGEGGRAAASVPISICVCVLVCYVTSGAIVFHKLQSWSVLESLYFCFTSLGTIGFGELAPSGTVTLYTASAYILVGMAVVAMCFSLIQTEIVMWLRRFSVQEHVTPKAEELALVTVPVTPKPS